MQINPGQLNKRIRIITDADLGDKDSDGFPITTETVVHECWARVSNVSGVELIKANADFSKVNTRFLIRYTSKVITTDMIIRFKSVDYNIRYINNYGFSNEYIEILAEVVRL